MDQPVSILARLGNVQAAFELLKEEVECLKLLFERPSQTELSKSANVVIPQTTMSNTVIRHRKGPRTTMTVSWKGKLFSGACAADVMADCLAAMGLERVRALGMRRGPHLLVSKDKPPPDRGSRLRDGLYVITHASNQEKGAILEEVAKGLNEQISVHVYK